jgi:hypothetical protein
VKKALRLVLLAAMVSAGSALGITQFDTPMPQPTCGPTPPCALQ